MYFEEQEENDRNERVLEGSPMEILKELEAFAQHHRINTDNKQWPKSPSALRRLNQVRSNLLEGLRIVIIISRKDKSKANTAHMEIRKIPSNTSNASNGTKSREITAKPLEAFQVLETRYLQLI